MQVYKGWKITVELNNKDVFAEENGEKEGREENDMFMLDYVPIESCC